MRIPTESADNWNADYADWTDQTDFIKAEVILLRRGVLLRIEEGMTYGALLYVLEEC